MGARLKYTPCSFLFHNIFIKMNKKVNYAYQYLSRTETINKKTTHGDGPRVLFFKVYQVFYRAEFAKSRRPWGTLKIPQARRLPFS